MGWKRGRHFVLVSKVLHQGCHRASWAPLRDTKITLDVKWAFMRQ